MSQYPKPLSEKRIRKLYEEANLSEKQIDFLHQFFAACANLYGYIIADEAWDVYKQLSSITDVIHLKRKDLFSAMSILRREHVPYRILEADEVFFDEPKADKSRVVAHQDLVLSGYYRFAVLFQLMDHADGHEFFVPKDLLKYAAPLEDKYERKLLSILEKLESTNTEYVGWNGKRFPCKYTGKRLCDFSFVSPSDDFDLQRYRGEIEGHRGDLKKAEELEAILHSVNAAQYLVAGLRRRSNIGEFSYSESLEIFMRDLQVMGVEISSDGELQPLLTAISEMHNHQHLWCNRGWAPDDLMHREIGPGFPRQISFGPNIQKAFDEGKMNREELLQKMRELGIEVLE